jgi:hypothetical protein
MRPGCGSAATTSTAKAETRASSDLDYWRSPVSLPNSVTQALREHLEAFPRQKRFGVHGSGGRNGQAHDLYHRVWLPAGKRSGIKGHVRVHDLRHPRSLRSGNEAPPCTSLRSSGAGSRRWPDHDEPPTVAPGPPSCRAAAQEHRRRRRCSRARSRPRIRPSPRP